MATRISTKKQDPLRETNKQFSDQDFNFRRACERAGISPTGRQAGKWRRQEGKAYTFRFRE